MKCKSFQQFAIVRADTATAFEEQLNARIKDLADKNPQVKFDGLTAYISYMETAQIPETLADASELNGVRFLCKDCPMFDYKRNELGGVDRRSRWGFCEIEGKTHCDSPACDWLFEMINEGKVGLCFRKPE